MNVSGNYKSSLQGNLIYSHQGSLGKTLKETCLKIVDLLKRIFSLPVEFLKHCFSGRNVVRHSSPPNTKIECVSALAVQHKVIPQPVAEPRIQPQVRPRVLLWPQPFRPFAMRQEPLPIEGIQRPLLQSLSKQFQDFLKLVKPLDQGVKTALSMLCEETEPLTLEQLGSQIERYHARLLDALSLDNLKQRQDYVAAIQTFLKTHPQSNLFPKVGLKDQDPQAPVYEVPRILASLLSPVLDRAFQQMREGREGIYSSSYFAGELGGKVADFLKTGKVYFDRFAQAMDLYEISHHLMSDGLQEECRKRLISDASSLQKPEEMETLWALATFYEDSALQFACIQNAQHQTSPDQTSPSLLEKRTILQNLKGSLIGTPCIDRHQRATAVLREFNPSALDKCFNVGMQSIQIMYATPQMDMAKLRFFKCLDLDFQPGTNDQAIVEAISSLLNENKALTELKLRLPQLSAASAGLLIDALQKSSLKSFELRFCEMDAEAVSAIAKQLPKNQKLEKVTLRGTGLGQEGLQQLAEGLKNNNQIRQLAFPGCKIESSLPAFKESLKSRLPKLEIVV